MKKPFQSIDSFKDFCDCIARILNPLVAFSAIITCMLTAYELKSGSDNWRKMFEMVMAKGRPIICVERHRRLDADGKTFNHEDCKVFNVGEAPRCYKVREIKEYLEMTFYGAPVPNELRKIVIPVHYYTHGVLSQNLTGIIAEKKGENSCEKLINHYKRAKEFFSAKGIGYYNQEVIVVHVQYEDKFENEVDVYFKAESVGGQHEISKDMYEQYAKDSNIYLEYPVAIDVDKIDLNVVLDNWVLAEVPKKVKVPQ